MAGTGAFASTCFVPQDSHSLSHFFINRVLGGSFRICDHTNNPTDSTKKSKKQLYLFLFTIS
jgi:hypothetical protein